MFSYIHLVLHGLVPVAVAWFFFRDDWKRAALIMLAANLVDLDHLVADTVYDPNRCSINFHPLHKMLPISLYGAMMFLPAKPLRYLGIGLIIHMLLDATDCAF
ncbi:DUF6122 family protein [Microbulbifer marinus]|uniref:LexA-binding, inner membrane-associated hydrolase n=1 Tax=Microbulbifer marinus TaxID=658218 RepID=A0A1H3WIX5_9GAMM|nr:DUF6122 family protein [Microbulbifer marinus]SDZ86900.1 hypothetical protein SAMN05216562_0885 [Microbulbifer marinus]